MPGAAAHPDQSGNLEILGADAMAADGAIAIKNGTIAVTKSTAAALTLAAPIATTDDGKQVTVIDTVGQQHTITTPSNKINGNKHIVTMSTGSPLAAAVGTSVVFVAYQGVWYVDTVGVSKGVTVT